MNVKELRDVIANLPDDARIIVEIRNGRSSETTLWVKARESRDIFRNPALTIEADNGNDVY